MIFLRGGQTSHGSIVAREFGIPAIIDNKAQGIKDGVILEMDGDAGEWRIV
jgi:phosphoenolpyruvate-protein kinase (PTS system EI component)